MKTQNIKSTMWIDPKFNKLSTTGKLLWVYFLTSEQSNIAGIFECSISSIADQVGITKKQVIEEINAISKLDMGWHYNDYVILKNRWEYNTLTNNNILSGIRNIISEIPDKVKKFILELDNELTWAIEATFSIDLKISKKMRLYRSHTQKQGSSHTQKQDRSHTGKQGSEHAQEIDRSHTQNDSPEHAPEHDPAHSYSYLNLNSNSLSLGSEQSDSFSKTMKYVIEEYDLMPKDRRKIEKIAKIEMGREAIQKAFEKTELNEKVEDKCAYFLSLLKDDKK